VNTPGCGETRGARVVRFGDSAGWELVPSADEGSPVPIRRSIEAMLACVERGVNDHPLNGRSARADLEVIMAAFESAHRRASVELPLAFGHSPLDEMVAAGAL
jgi:predicted dehydrogenase